MRARSEGGMLMNRTLERDDFSLNHIVIASEAKQSRVVLRCSGLLRHYVPRNDDSIKCHRALAPQKRGLE